MRGIGPDFAKSEARARDTVFVLSDEEMRLLERVSSDAIPEHVESSVPGELPN